jgi:hypothetical protein
MPNADDRAIYRLARRQQGAISRAQVLASGGSASMLRGKMRSGRWRRIWPGVYVTFTGPIPWMTRAHAALLYAGSGAVLGPRASSYLHRISKTPPRTIDVLVPSTRTVVDQPGLRVSGGARPERAAPSQPRHLHRAATVVALLELARTDDELVAALCDGVRAGCPPEALLEELATRARMPQRRLLQDMLAEVQAGIESPLERRFHHDVERRHGLPRAVLQQRQRLRGKWIRADRVFRGHGVRAELDGRLAHPGGRTDEDCWRDNEVGIADGDLTLRYRWRHVVGAPCTTAAQVARALRSRG